MKSKKSHMVCLDLDTTNIVAFHSLLNNPHLIEFENEEDKNEFILALNDGSIESGFEVLDKLSSFSDNDARTFLTTIKESYLSKVSKRINYLSLLIAESCNLSCSYCITSENLKSAFRKRKRMMPFNIAQKSIDWYLNLPSFNNEYYINFSGGEPLLNKKVFIDSVNYIKSQNHLDKPIKITLNTNATLVDKYLAKFICDNNIEIATSLDGSPKGNDKVRITKKGLPTSPAILKGWKMLRDYGCNITGFMATFNENNFPNLDKEIVDFAVDMRFKWIRITFDVVNSVDIPISEAIEKLWSVYTYGFEKNILIEGYWSTSANNLLCKNRIPDDVGFFCGAVSGETVSVHTDGRISTCGFSIGSFGNIHDEESFDFNKHNIFVSGYFPGNRLECNGCDIEGSCAGGCHITREVASKTSNDKAINYNCTIIKEMTSRLLLHHFRNNKNLLREKSYSNVFGL